MTSKELKEKKSSLRNDIKKRLIELVAKRNVELHIPLSVDGSDDGETLLGVLPDLRVETEYDGEIHISNCFLTDLSIELQIAVIEELENGNFNIVDHEQ